MIEERDDRRLGQRLREAERTIAAAHKLRAPFVTGAPKRSPRATVSDVVGLAGTAVAGLVLILAVAVGYSMRQGGAGMPSLPTGTFVPNEVVGTTPVEATMCAAIGLDPDAVTKGKATVFWWSSDSPGCANRDSSVMAQTADLRAVTLGAADGLLQRDGYELSFVVALVPSGSHEVSLTLDPEFASRHGLELAAIRLGEKNPTLAFTRVERLAIPGPEDNGPVPTPFEAPAS